MDDSILNGIINGVDAEVVDKEYRDPNPNEESTIGEAIQIDESEALRMLQGMSLPSSISASGGNKGGVTSETQIKALLNISSVSTATTSTTSGTNASHGTPIINNTGGITTNNNNNNISVDKENQQETIFNVITAHFCKWSKPCSTHHDQHYHA
jgi:hypothetical protein